MKSHFAIFGPERTSSIIEEDEKSGQPYIFRKYPAQFASHTFRSNVTSIHQDRTYAF